MNALSRIALALLAVLTISGCVVEDGGHWRGDRDYHYR
jgi:hypothetical protein